MHQAPGPIHFPKRLLPFPTAFQSSFSKVPTRQSSGEQAVGAERGHRRQPGRDQAQQQVLASATKRKSPGVAGPFCSVHCLVSYRSSRFDAGGVNASQIASGRTIQNNIGMTRLAFARHGFGREKNARMKRLFRGGRASRYRCLVMDSALRRTRSIRYPLIRAGVVQW